jgi:hypothetical protein
LAMTGMLVYVTQVGFSWMSTLLVLVLNKISWLRIQGYSVPSSTQSQSRSGAWMP